MVNKNRNQDMYAMWYDLSNEIGKQFFEISDIGNMNYANLQEFWNEYSKRMGQQIYELMILDKDSYKGMLTLWEDFKDQMNTQISYITNFKDNNYIQWYEKWLDYTDRIKKEFTAVIQKQLHRQTELYDMNELWMTKFGLNEEYKQQIMDTSRIMSEYWLEAVTKTTEIVKESLNPGSKIDFANKFQEFYDYLTWSYSNMAKRLVEIQGLNNLKDYNITQYPLDFNLLQQFLTNNLHNFGFHNNDSDKLYKDIETLKNKVTELSKELDKYKRQKTRSRKRKK